LQESLTTTATSRCGIVGVAEFNLLANRSKFP
jgi:hypothetical protein